MARSQRHQRRTAVLIAPRHRSSDSSQQSLQHCPPLEQNGAVDSWRPGPLRPAARGDDRPKAKAAETVGEGVSQRERCALQTPATTSAARARVLTATLARSRRRRPRSALDIALLDDPNYRLVTNWNSSGECRTRHRLMKERSRREAGEVNGSASRGMVGTTEGQNWS